MNTPEDRQNAPGRRAFLRTGAAALAGLGVGSAGLLSGCDRGGDTAKGAPAAPGAPSGGGGPARAFDLAAGRVEAEVGPGQVWRTWGYDGQYPGPEIRLKEGERLRVAVENQLPEGAGTTVHWHGVPVPNPMDGVPGVTQEPIPAGGSMTYEYEATPAGTYMYHSHRALQLDRGLVGPLIIEERTPHVEYDREHTVILDDFLPGPPPPETACLGIAALPPGSAEPRPPHPTSERPALPSPTPATTFALRRKNVRRSCKEWSSLMCLPALFEDCGRKCATFRVAK